MIYPSLLYPSPPSYNPPLPITPSFFLPNKRKPQAPSIKLITLGTGMIDDICEKPVKRHWAQTGNMLENAHWGDQKGKMKLS